MDVSALDNRLTDSERETFEREGYLCIEDALPPDRVEDLVAAVDRVHADGLSKGQAPDKAMFVGNFIPLDKAFAELVDYEKVLPKVWGLLGWNIYLYHAHLIVTPPSGKPRSDASWGWHQDSDRVNHDIETHPRPRLSLKVGYFLSDVSEEGRGNFWVVPGTHLDDELEVPPGTWKGGWKPAGEGQPKGAVPVLAKPGTAVLFDRRLWHAASTNWSDVTRKVLFYGYAYRWLRPKDNMTVDALWADSSPIRKQLLGYTTSENGRYSPSDVDAPLRAWLQEHSPAEVA